MRITENRLRRLIRNVIKESNMMDRSENDQAIAILENYLSQLNHACNNNTLDGAFDNFNGKKTANYYHGFAVTVIKIVDIFGSISSFDKNSPYLEENFDNYSPLGRELSKIRRQISQVLRDDKFHPRGPARKIIPPIIFLIEEVIQKLKDGSLCIVQYDDKSYIE